MVSVNRVTKLKSNGFSVRRCVDQGSLGKSNVDRTGQGGNRRIGPVNLSIVADRFDLFQIVGISHFSADDVGKRRAVLFDIALKFTQRSWVYRGFLDINARNGYVLMAEITLSDLYMFNNVGDELECVVKGGMKYLKKFKIKNGKVEETIDL